ncbi:MAG: hypothetical protein IJK52_01840 [Oscillospiraceae bacterium]|nr:hypothetical protein [Oscillospiraceae bacterium]
MVYLYSGTPGSGKTTHAAQTILDSVKKKICVLANFEINTDILSDNKELFHYIPNEELTVKRLREFSRSFFGGKRIKEGGILLVVDEAQLLFSPMMWQQTYAQGWLGFFTQHRKYGFDIILITQIDRMINRQVRGLIEYEYIHRKVRNIGGFWGLILSFFLGQFYCVETWYQVRNLRTGGHAMYYSKRAFKLFDTFKSWD